MISATALTLTYPDLPTATRLTASLTERTYTCDDEFVTRRRCGQSVIQQSMSFLQAFQQAVALQKLRLCLQVGLLAMAFGCCTYFSVCCYGWQMMLHHLDKELDRRRHVNTQLQFATVFSVLRTKMTKLMRLVLVAFISFDCSLALCFVSTWCIDCRFGSAV